MYKENVLWQNQETTTPTTNTPYWLNGTGNYYKQEQPLASVLIPLNKRCFLHFLLRWLMNVVQMLESR